MALPLPFTGMQTREGQDFRIPSFSPALLFVPYSHTTVYEFAEAAITNHHRLSGFNNRNVFLTFRKAGIPRSRWY